MRSRAWRVFGLLIGLGLSFSTLPAEPGDYEFGACGYKSVSVDHLILPVFTEDPLKIGRKTDVVVDLVVDAEGNLTGAGCFYTPDPSFDKPALAAVMRSRFSPGLECEVPVPSFRRLSLSHYFIQVRPKATADFVPATPRWALERSLADQIGSYSRFWKRSERIEILFEIDEKGQVTKIKGTDDLSKRLAEHFFEKGKDRLPFVPAVSEGKNVASQVMMCLDPGRKSSSRISFDREVARPMPFCPEVEAGFAPVEVAVIARFDSSGELSAANVLGDAPRAFGFEAIRAVGDWTVEVPEVEGAPVSQTFEIRFLFIDGEEFGSLLAEPRAVVFVPPTTIKKVAPVYPEKLKNRGIQAVVEVLFVVDEEGEVVDPEIRFTSHPGFNEAALTALRAWEFEPGLLDGVPVDSRQLLPMIFVLGSR